MHSSLFCNSLAFLSRRSGEELVVLLRDEFSQRRSILRFEHFHVLSDLHYHPQMYSQDPHAQIFWNR